MAIPTKSLEFLLEAWRDHSKTGFHVTILIAPEDQDFFKSCADGQRFQAVLVKLTDDEKPAPLPTPADLKREEKARAARGAAEAKAHGITVPELEAQQPLWDARIGTPEQKAAQHAKNVEASKLLDNVVNLPEPKEHHGKFPGGLCGLAVKWCTDEHFHAWLEVTYPEAWAKFRQVMGDSDETIAKNVVCYLCAIESRKELDTNHHAEAAFRTDIMGPYREQRQADGIDDAPF